MLILNPLKNFYKTHHKKVISKTSLANMSKSGKRAYFCHIFANNFFWYIKNKIFNGFEISVKFCFFDTFFIFLTFFLKIILVLFQTLNANAHETAQKN
jgi:hypothetical protein